jgi:hypothetical protein
LQKLDLYDQSKGKAFSYFGTIAKRYLIIYNQKNYKKLVAKSEIGEQSDDNALLNSILVKEPEPELDKLDVVELFIKYVDELKIELIGKVEGPEKVKTAKMNDKESIIWKKYDPSLPLLPARLYLQAIETKDNFDIPMHEIVGSEISKIDPTKKGKKLWELYKGLRTSIVEISGNYKEGDKNVWKVKVKEINKFKDFQDLEKQILNMFNAPGNKVNPEDLEALVSIYQELTKQEFDEHHEAKNIHWLGRTFDHAPLVGALASLSSMQNEILAARAKAVNLLKSKVTTGEHPKKNVSVVTFLDTGYFSITSFESIK